MSDMIRRRRARSGYGRGLQAPTLHRWRGVCNPSHDSPVLAPFEELYALTHTIQRNNTHRREDKQESDYFGVERADVKCPAPGNITPAMTMWPFILGVRPTASQSRDFSM